MAQLNGIDRWKHSGYVILENTRKATRHRSGGKDGLSRRGKRADERTVKLLRIKESTNGDLIMTMGSRRTWKQETPLVTLPRVPRLRCSFSGTNTIIPFMSCRLKRGEFGTSAGRDPSQSIWRWRGDCKVRVLWCVWCRHIRTSQCLHGLQYICHRPPHMSAALPYVRDSWHRWAESLAARPIDDVTAQRSKA